MTKEEARDTALEYFNQGYACSQSILLTFAPSLGLDELNAKRISSTFGGGMGRLRQKCGAVTGGFMVLGLKYGNIEPKDLDTKLNAYAMVRALDKRIEEVMGTTSCKEILQQHATAEQVESRQHHRIICRKVVAETAEAVFDLLEKTN